MSDDNPVFYTIEEQHLSALKDASKRLRSGEPMSAEEMREIAFNILIVVVYAEVLKDLQKPGKPYVHLNLKEKP